MDDIIHIDLPSGGWWEFHNPREYGNYMDYVTNLISPANDDYRPETIALISYTKAWSFESPISYESLRTLDIEDGIVGQQAFNDKVLPFLSRIGKTGVNSTAP